MKLTPILLLFTCAIIPFYSINGAEVVKNSLGIDIRYDYSDQKLSQYLQWVNETLDESRKNNNFAVIVDKSAYTMYLIKNGEIYQEFPIEIGQNPFDEKKYEGDMCTPVGQYRISNKFPTSTYYKALLLNYPNESDKERFNQLKQKVLIPEKAKIGGAIEIHGKGTGYPGNKGGENWTLGCVALSNKQIDQLFPYVSSGTQVTIVTYGAYLKFDSQRYFKLDESKNISMGPKVESREVSFSIK